MKIKSNWQRYLIMDIICVLQSLIFGLIFLIYRVNFDLPLWSIIIFLVLAMLSFILEPLTLSEKIFIKFCNHKCDNCKMWHCNYSIK